MNGPANESHDLAPPAMLADRDRRLRVLIADHDGLARSMIRSALSEDDRVAVVFTAGEGHEALQLARYYRPTVAIVETMLPPTGGVELITRILHASPETRILTISVDNEEAVIDALRVGSVGHIDKDTDPSELPGLVARAADGEAIVPERLIRQLLRVVREVPSTGWRPLRSRLTTREWEVVELLAQGATTQHIADQLVLSTTTIYSHIRNVLRKLRVHTRDEAIAAAAQLRKQEALGRKPLNPVPTNSSTLS
jgi:DNA-binding NarL/FixJ family response regulator